MKPLLLDATALEALFGGHDGVTALWLGAEQRSAPVLLPSTAIAEANRKLQATDSAWDAILLTPNVVALELSAASALGASRIWSGLAAAHATYEALATEATIVTADPESYDASLPLVTFSR